MGNQAQQAVHCVAKSDEAKKQGWFDINLTNGKWDSGEVIVACGAALLGLMSCWGTISSLLSWIPTILIGAAVILVVVP